MLQRRQFILNGILGGASLSAGMGASLSATLGLGAPAQASETGPDDTLLEVFKTPTCGCCAAWVAHMAEAGFATRAHDVDQNRLWAMKSQAGLTPELSSCHTAFIGGYVIEGHVPARDVLRLLTERPDALGLSVPGMPIGSPGMEMGDRRDPYDTILVLGDGTTQVFQRHG